MQQQFLDFVDKFDFKGLVQLLNTGEWEFINVGTIVTSYVFIGVVVVIIALTFSKKTKSLGKMLAFWLPVAVFYFAGGVVLKNSVISQVGPFILAMLMGCGVFGYLLYQKMIKG